MKPIAIIHVFTDSLEQAHEDLLQGNTTGALCTRVFVRRKKGTLGLYAVVCEWHLVGAHPIFTRCRNAVAP
jgi:hypothetical protein